MKKRQLVLALLITVLLVFVAAGCSGNSTPKTPASSNNSQNEQNNEGKGNEVKETQKPQEIETIRVSIWERGNAPEGQKITDTLLSRWINEQMEPLGVKVELVPLPRSEESAKLSAWMASGTAPDVVLSYDINTFLKYASQGGLAPLDDAIAKYGQDIMVNNKEAMEAAGTHKGARYAIMARKASIGGPTMSIRQDWLDKLQLKTPTTLDELYDVLKAFKEKDPGGVGKDKVIPYSIPAIAQGSSAFMYGTTFGAGMGNDGPASQIYFATGKVVDGQFKSGVVLPEGREHFRFMNKLYKEGLIPKEFITDLNSQKHIENVMAGYVGFMDANKQAYGWNEEMVKSVPGVNWVTIEPFKAPDGEQIYNAGSPFGMFIMVPKTSADKADAVVKYLNWMSDPDVIVALYDGFEGEHYKVEDGIRIVLDVDKKKNEISWYAPDLAIMSLGLPWYPSDLAKKQYADKGEQFVEGVIQFREIIAKYGKFQPTITNERPWTEKNMSALENMLYEELSKVIIAQDFDAAYDTMLQKWDKMGADKYDEEVTAGLKEIGKIK